MTYYPELFAPENSKTSGILAGLAVADLFIDEFVSNTGFKVLMLYCDGASANLAALRMLCTELNAHKTLLVVPIVCAAHALNNAVIWGLGSFRYGSS